MFAIIKFQLCRRVRIFRFASGKLRRSYDESPEAASELQKSGSEQIKLDSLDFGRRVAAVRFSSISLANLMFHFF